jgi:glycosyltransferase involved in cell wall biosynthesis
MTHSQVCLIVEGSYPYVSGGVANCVEQLIINMPDITFDLVILKAKSDEDHTLRYNLPKNINNITHIYLQDGVKKPVFLPQSPQSIISELNELFKSNYAPDIFKELILSINKLSDTHKLKQELIYSKFIYDKTCELFHQYGLDGQSFLNFFWSLRSLCLGIINCIIARIPACDTYHCVSTGYAGLTGAIQKILYPDSQLILTEHGIYTRERRMEISIAQWPDTDQDEYKPSAKSGFYKQIWIEVFAYLSKLCYTHSDHIIALFEKNNLIQAQESAPEQKLMTIHNGINCQLYKAEEKDIPDSPVIGFLGRITKIKDIKTLIRAFRLIKNKIPDARLIVAGPTALQDESYLEECHTLVEMLNLKDSVSFPGKVASHEFLADIHVLALTSLSEGQPLVVLEAFACGVPAVIPDVGGCKELILGGKNDDAGIAGVLTQQSNPGNTAEAILKLLKKPSFYKRCSKNAIKRVENFYNETALIQRYSSLYLREKQ